MHIVDKIIEVLKKYNRKFRKLFPAWNFIEYLLLRIPIEFINLFPISISTWIARKIGDLMFLILPKRRRVAIKNLNIAYGNSKSASKKIKIALESFRHLMVSIMELFRLPKFVKVSRKYVHFEGEEHINRALAKGKGIVFVMSHLGPWEYLAFFSYIRKHPATIMGRAIRNPYIYRWVKHLRSIIDLEHSDKDMGLRSILSELRHNHLVAIAIDQWAGNEGLWIDFFTTPTSTTSLPARLAKRTGCALIPAFCIRTASGRYKIYMEQEVSFNKDDDAYIVEATRQLNRLLEKKILAFPEQWAWMHDRWKGKKVKNKL